MDWQPLLIPELDIWRWETAALGKAGEGEQGESGGGGPQRFATARNWAGERECPSCCGPCTGYDPFGHHGLTPSTGVGGGGGTILAGQDCLHSARFSVGGAWVLLLP